MLKYFSDQNQFRANVIIAKVAALSAKLNEKIELKAVNFDVNRLQCFILYSLLQIDFLAINSVKIFFRSKLI